MGLIQILLVLIGIGIVVLGIYIKVHNYRMRHQGIKVTAVVAYAEPVAHKIAGEEITGYQNVIHIQTEYGTVTQKLEESSAREPGEQIRGYYIQKTDQFMKEEDVDTNSGAGPYALIGFGVMLISIILLADWMERSELGAIVASRIFAYGICLVFIVVGVGCGIAQIRGRKEEKRRGHRIQGNVVDYRENTSGNAAWMFWLFAVIGLAVLVFLISQEMEQRRNGRLEPLFQSEESAGARYDREENNGYAPAVTDHTDSQVAEFDVNAFQKELNSDGYCYRFVDTEIPADTEYVEYYYMPLEEKEGTFGYLVRIYDNGVGQLTMFPSVTMQDKSFRQCIAFWCGKDAVATVGKDIGQYDMEELCARETEEEAVDYGIYTGNAGELSEYIYYYDGSGRTGSGGTQVHAEPFHTVRGHIIDGVPDSVWTAVKDEMADYFTP